MTDDDREALAADLAFRLRLAVTDRRRANSEGRSCMACRHRNAFLPWPGAWLCDHPHAPAGDEWLRWCVAMRSLSAPCGPTGALWEGRNDHATADIDTSASAVHVAGAPG